MAMGTVIKRSFISLVLLGICIFAHGVVLSVLWHMFIVPVYGLPGITTTTAMGMSLIARLLTGNKILSASKELSYEENDNFISNKVEVAVLDVLNSGMILAFGFFIFRFFALIYPY
jgi:hypothetical protein